MTRKRRRLAMVLAGMACLGIATALVLNAFSDNLVYFYGPTELAARHPVGRHVRIGGLVEVGSLTTGDDGKRFVFKVTDGKADIPVTFVGVAPALFREGQGVVAEGKLDADGQFTATTLLAKHDEKYMPPEVAEALKKSGEWHREEEAAAGPPAARASNAAAGNAQTSGAATANAATVNAVVPAASAEKAP